MSDQKRPYRKQRRAELEEQTRRRITESAVALHGSVGPAKTSMSAVAQHAGVQRSTLYRHFPDEAALFAACSAHWERSNPLPDLAAWASTPDPDDRLLGGLAELYGWYGRTEPMVANLYRDMPLVPVVGELWSGFAGYLGAAADALLAGRGLRGAPRRRVRAALGHAVAFATWRSLVREQGLAEAEAIALMQAAVSRAAARA